MAKRSPIMNSFFLIVALAFIFCTCTENLTVRRRHYRSKSANDNVSRAASLFSQETSLPVTEGNVSPSIMPAGDSLFLPEVHLILQKMAGSNILRILSPGYDEPLCEISCENILRFGLVQDACLTRQWPTAESLNAKIVPELIKSFELFILTKWFTFQRQLAYINKHDLM